MQTQKRIQITKTRVRVNDSKGLFVLNWHAYTSNCSVQNTWYLMYMEKALVCVFGIFSFLCLYSRVFFPFKLTPLLAAYHLSVLSDFSHLKMKYIIKPDNNCVKYVALFYSLWTNKGQVPKCIHFHAHQIICFCNTENNTAWEKKQSA